MQQQMRPEPPITKQIVDRLTFGNLERIENFINRVAYRVGSRVAPETTAQIMREIRRNSVADAARRGEYLRRIDGTIRRAFDERDTEGSIM